MPESTLAALPLLDLTRRYCEPHRRYHSLHHVLEMLEYYHEFVALHSNQLTYDPAQVLAIWYHDAIYEPTRKDNEEASARLMLTQLGPLGVDPEVLEAAAQIIRDTVTHEPSSLRSALVLDLDLLPLSADWDRFMHDTGLIREEYGHVPESDWVEGRRKFIANMLNRPRIYTGMPDEVESTARNNLLRQLDLLG